MRSFRSAPRAPQAVFSRYSFVLLSAITAACLPIMDAQAQTRLAPVVVIATREPVPLDQVTADVVVIDAQRIRESAADSVEDLLRREAGVQLSRTGGPGHSAGIFIRGASSQSTLVLVDGVRIGSATLGQVSFDAISLAQIERIEVLRGPGSSLYGADALGGVVRITTRRGEGPASFSGHIAAGEYGSKEGEISVGGAGGGFDYTASFSRESSDGASTLRAGDRFGNYNPDRDGYSRRTAQLRLGYTVAPGHRVAVSLVDARLRSQYDASEFAPPDYAQDPSPNFGTRLDTQVLAVSYDGVISPIWTTRVQLAHNADESLDGAHFPDRFITRRDQYTWQNAFALDARQQLVAVLERLEERAKTSAFSSEKRRHNDSLGLGYSGKFGAHLLSADVRHDDNSVYGGKTTGRLGWGYELGHGLTARALAGTTFRAPSFNDLFYTGYGVDTVRPERGRSAEIGLSWLSGDSNASVTLYRNRVRDLIAYEPDRAFCPVDSSYDFGCARNINRARLQGATLTAGHRIGSLSLRGTVDLLNAKDERSGERLERRARHQETLSADYQIEAWTFGATLMTLGNRPDGGKRLGGYSTLDLQARWRLSTQWQLEAKVLNVGDRDIEPARDYRALGRQGWIGLRYSGIGL
ncbi:MAG: TonB-dependent receptor [Burkholderiaceae bacterium]|nr:TonB-dependent receptor [Burkholderiaceae bacterium]